MLNESLLSLSLTNLKMVVLQDLSVYDVALTYVLLYVVYKALGRYIYFKPQEHASKINRTFLVLSLLIVFFHFSEPMINFLPIYSGHRWVYAASMLVLFVAPLSILMARILWEYDKWGRRGGYRFWGYIPIPKDFYKTPVPKSVQKGSLIDSWEEEGVESTAQNLHSDALVNVLALSVYIFTLVNWAQDSLGIYGWYSIAFAAIVSFWVAILYVNEGIFTWIEFIQKRGWAR